MSKFNGDRFRLPRLQHEPSGPAALQVASPLNDYQVVALMAAMLAARDGLSDDIPERNRRADLATAQAIDLLGHAAYKMGRGAIAATIHGAQQQGMADAKAALEAEEARQREAPTPPTPPSGTALLDEHGNPA